VFLYSGANWISTIKKPPTKWMVFSWLGRQYVNGTFTDEDFQNVDDVEEIQKLLDDTAEDESCSE
jgi:hypothetical protein